MHDVWVWLVRVFGAAGALIAGLLGGWDVTIMVLCGLMIVDFATGWLVAYHGRSNKSEGGGLSSQACFIGVARKLVTLVLVAVAAGIDWAIGAPNVLRQVTILFFISNEGLSITENAALLGVKMPAALKAALEAMRDKQDDPPMLT